MIHKIEGIRTKDKAEVLLDGKAVRHIIRHSPTGLEFGYAGSGPADTAYSILHALYGREIAEKYHQRFKFDHVSIWPEQGFKVEIDTDKWLENAKTTKP